MAFLERCSYYNRMASGLWDAMGTPPLEDAADFVQQQLESRERSFLVAVGVNVAHVFDSALQRVPTAGRITATGSTSRQIQIAAKWAF